MTYEFGSCRIDVESRLVWRDASNIELTRKAFDLLLLLIQSRPAVVSKEDVYARLWPDTFVTESSIQALVSEIRQAIGDDGASQKWIRTVRGIGYAFCGEAAETKSVGTRAALVRGWLVAESVRLPLREGDNIVGRDSDDVMIDASGISRRHARITIGRTVFVEDLGSKNGTWVRDVRVTEPTALGDGDSVRFGHLLFTFRFSRAADSTDTQSQT